MKYLPYILVALLAVGNTSAAKAWEAGILHDSSGCLTTSRAADNKTIIGLVMRGSPPGHRFTLGFVNTSWDIPKNTKGSLYVAIDDNVTEYSTEYGGEVLTTKDGFFVNIGDDLLAEIMIGNRMYYRAGTLEGTLSLSGSARAVDLLFQCVRRLPKANPFGNEKDKNPFGNPVSSPVYDM